MLKSNYFLRKDRQPSDDTTFLVAIGQKLKSARQTQGLSLIQLHERTKIPIKQLEALDNGNAQDLPEPVYVSGFIKRYAQSVGLDEQALCEEYKQYVGKTNNNERNRKVHSSPYYASPEYIAKTRRRVSTPIYKLWFFNGVIIICVICSITWFINTQSNNLPQQSNQAITSLTASTAKLMAANGLSPVRLPSGESAKSTDKMSSSLPQKTENITLVAIRHVWVEVKRMSNGENLYTGFMEQGDKKDFGDGQGLIVRTGDAGDLAIEKQGKTETFGEPGKVAERTFIASTPEQMLPQAGNINSTKTNTNGVSTADTSSVLSIQKNHTSTTAATVAGSSKWVKHISEPTKSNKTHWHKYDSTAHQYMPGELLNNGTKSTDVPYRYSD